VPAHPPHARARNGRGDTFFPLLDAAQWEEVAREDRAADERHAHACSFLTCGVSGSRLAGEVEVEAAISAIAHVDLEPRAIHTAVLDAPREVVRGILEDQCAAIASREAERHRALVVCNSRHVEDAVPMATRRKSSESMIVPSARERVTPRPSSVTGLTPVQVSEISLSRASARQLPTSHATASRLEQLDASAAAATA